MAARQDAEKRQEAHLLGKAVTDRELAGPAVAPAAPVPALAPSAVGPAAALPSFYAQVRRRLRPARQVLICMARAFACFLRACGAHACSRAVGRRAGGGGGAAVL